MSTNDLVHEHFAIVTFDTRKKKTCSNTKIHEHIYTHTNTHAQILQFKNRHRHIFEFHFDLLKDNN